MFDDPVRAVVVASLLCSISALVFVGVLRLVTPRASDDERR